MTYEKPELLEPRGVRNGIGPIFGNGNCVVCGGVVL